MVTEQILAMVFNLEIFFLFIGGAFALFLTVTIIYSKQEFKRNIERNRLKLLKSQDAEQVGDIEEKLDQSYEFNKLNYGHLLVNFGLQPLFIIGFVNLFNNQGIIEIIIVFILIIWTITHELWASAKYSEKFAYQFLLLIVWLLLFLFMSYQMNTLSTI